jgi:hypothetical protein
MQIAIHVGVGEGCKILALVFFLVRKVVVVLRCVNFIDVFVFELSEHFRLDFEESFETRLVL